MTDSSGRSVTGSELTITTQNSSPTTSWTTTNSSTFSGSSSISATATPDSGGTAKITTWCLTVNHSADTTKWPGTISGTFTGGYYYPTRTDNCWTRYNSDSLTGATFSFDTTKWSNASYIFQVTVTDSSGRSVTGSVLTVVVGNMSASPTSPTVTPSHAQLLVGWSPPTGESGFPILSYRATANDGAGQSFSCTAAGSASSCAISGLTDGVTYSVSVVAINSAGTSSPTVALSVTPNRFAMNLQSVVRGATVVLTWQSTPTDDQSIVQKSYDGVTWTTAGTTTSRTFTVTQPAVSYYFRVLSSTGVASNVVGVTTPGLAQQSVQFVTSTGQPVSGGSVSWAMANGGSRSSIVYGLLSDGTYTFPAAPGGIVNLTLTNAVMPDGAFVSGTFHGVLSSGTVLVIALPEEPSSAINSVQVVTPSGVPVWGAKVSITNLSSRVTVGDATFAIPSQYSPCASSYYTYGCSLSNLQADINGTVTFWGYYGGSSDNWNDGETEISVVYDDGVVTQTPPSVVPTSSNTVVTLEYEPYVASISTTVVAPSANVLTGVTITLNAGAAPAFAGIRSHVAGYLANRRVTAVLPAGYRACAGQIVTAVTNARGQAAFKVCATQTGQIKFKTPGVLIPGAVSFFIAGTASQPVRMLHGTTPARGSASLTWVAPSFSGGVPVLSYQITISAPGKKTVTASTTKLQFSVAGLVNATRYTVTVRAVTRLGIGAPAAAVIAVA